MLREGAAAAQDSSTAPALAPDGCAVDQAFDLGGQVYCVRGIPRNWCSQLAPRLVRRRVEPVAVAGRVIDIELSRRGDLRAPTHPHDLNDTSELQYGEHVVTYRSDWCEGRFARPADTPVTLLCHVDAGPWFGGVVENMLRVLVAYDALQRGGVMLHCAALVRQGGAAALFGHSGAGKSTSSAVALAQGCSVVSDDINLLEPADGGWQVVPVPFSGTLNEASDIDRPVPLLGLFHLNKSPVDRSEACSTARAVSLLAGSTPFVNRDSFVAESLIAVLARLAADIPVHELYFTPAPGFLDLVFGGAA